MGALAPENASVVMFDSRTVDGSSPLSEVTICPSAPQSMIAGLRRCCVAACASIVESGGFGGGLFTGGFLTQRENPGRLLVVGNIAFQQLSGRPQTLVV